MTREEFIENVQSWSDLLDFCYDEGCDYCEDVYDDDAKDDYFDSEIISMARNADDWRDLYRQLEDIPTGYDYYIYDDYGWHGAEEADFDSHKSDVLSWGDNREVWDEYDEEEGYEEDEEILEEEYVADEAQEDEGDEELEEGCSLGELFTSSATKLQTIEIEAERKREQEEKFFEQFIASAV